MSNGNCVSIMLAVDLESFTFNYKVLNVDKYSFNIYNFEEFEGAFTLGLSVGLCLSICLPACLSNCLSVCLFLYVCLSVYPLCFAYGQEWLEIGYRNLIYRMCMKTNRTRIFFFLSVGRVIAELGYFRLFSTFALLTYGTLTKYLENRYS